MKVLNIFKGLISFLTVIPLRMENFLEISARYMFLFPLVGALIGSLAGLYSFFAYYLLGLLFGFLNNILFSGFQGQLTAFLAKGFASIMSLAFLIVLTGLQHTDGLVDVGNALSMGRASKEARMEIAHAWIVTRTGALLALVIYCLTVLLIFLVRPGIIIQSLVVAEVSAKLAMVTCAWQGSSVHKGLGSVFIDTMNKRHSLYVVALAISLLMGGILLGFQGALVVASGIMVGGFLIVVSKRVFGGVTGDIFGTTNEVARMIALLLLV